MNSKTKLQEMTPQQRAGLAIYFLMQKGVRLTTRQLSEKLGITQRGTRRLLTNLSGVGIPLLRDEEGCWAIGS